MTNKKMLVTLCALLQISQLTGCAQDKLAGKNSLEQAKSQNSGTVAEQAGTDQKVRNMSREEQAVIKDYADYLSTEFLYIKPGNSAGAETFIQKEIVITKPYNLFKILTYARLLNTKKKYSEAYQLTSKVLNDQKLSDYMAHVEQIILPHAYLTHAVSAAGLGLTGEALNFVNAADKFSGPNNYSSTTYYKAMVLAMLGHVPEATNYLRQRIDSNSSAKNADVLYWPRVLTYLAELYFAQNNLVQARDAYEAVVAYGDKADAALNVELSKKGLAYTKTFDEPEVHYSLAQTYALLGNKDKAIEHYGLVIKSAAYSTLAHTKRGAIYLEAKQYPEAITDFSAALKNEPRNTELLYKRAFSYCQIGSTVNAKADLNTIIAIDPKHPTAKYLLKQCHRT